jgi:hypothetical protein
MTLDLVREARGLVTSSDAPDLIRRLADEVERLERDLSDYRCDLDTAAAQANYWEAAASEERLANDDTQAENRRLRKALEFYADDANWMEVWTEVPARKGSLMRPSAVNVDGGERAKKALAECEREETK